MVVAVAQDADLDVSRVRQICRIVQSELANHVDTQPRSEVVFAILQELQKKAAWREASAIVKLLPAFALEPNHRFYVAAIRACEAASQTGAAADMLQNMLRVGVKPHMSVFHALLNCCARVGHSDEALRIINAMKWAQISPNAVSVTTAMKACVRGNDFDAALSLFDHFAFRDETRSDDECGMLELHELLRIKPGADLMPDDDQMPEEETQSLEIEEPFTAPWMFAYVNAPFCVSHDSSIIVHSR